MRVLDRLTGRVPTHTLVLALLVVIALVALGLSIAGELAYSPGELLASVAVAVAVTVLTSWIVALPFGVRFHVRSALITGLLLFFVLIPSSEPADLLVIALGAAAASASKFLVAWRGRHIVNPAAFGAFVVTVLGLGFSGWWVATGAMLPVVLVAALLVLHRTRTLLLGASFAAVAVGVLLIRYVVVGSDAVLALQTAFLSLPVVFFAGFMLSEPLTLPPRRWQQLVIAAVTGLLFSLPFALGPVYSSPQFALLVGNLIGFAFGQRRAIVLTFAGRRRLAPATWEFAFRPRHPVAFAPGQYMELHVPHAPADRGGRRRVFSISSAPAADAPLTFAMRVGDRPSSFKRALLDLEPGASIRGTRVAGDFLLPRDRATPLLLVAGGIGITPFASQLAHSSHDDVVVVYVVADPAELAYADTIVGHGARVVVVAPAAPEVLPPRWSYAGPGRVSRELLAASVPDIALRTAYVSGPPALVRDVARMLRWLRVRRVVTDAFTGY